jgi:hypothetical protein
LLRGDQISVEWIEERLLALPAEITELLLVPMPPEVQPLQVLWLLPFDDQQARKLAEIGGLPALEASVLLMKLGELICAPELRRFAREAYIRSQPSARSEPLLEPVVDQLIQSINEAYPCWVYVRPDERYELTTDPPTILGSRASTPDELLKQENDPLIILFLARCALQRRVLEARLRAAPLKDEEANLASTPEDSH